jgi:hypothetical protein
MRGEADQRGSVITVRATYMRQLEGHGIWLGEQPVELSAECEQFGDKVLTIWTDATPATLAALDFDAEELVGATEAMTEAFFAAEQEQCLLSKVRQQTGEVAA